METMSFELLLTDLHLLNQGLFDKKQLNFKKGSEAPVFVLIVNKGNRYKGSVF